MAALSLAFQQVDYITETRARFTACRALAEVAFMGLNRSRVDFSCMVDPGVPLSVIPYSLWHDRKIQWRRMGTRVKRQGRSAYESLYWQDVPCDLGITSVDLVDSLSGTQAGPLVMVAKFARQRLQPPNLEVVALLGMNFLADNNLQLFLEGHNNSITGYLSISQEA